MAIFRDRSGNYYFNAIAGFPGTNRELTVRVLDRKGAFVALYRAAALITGAVFIATIAVSVLPLSKADRDFGLIALGMVNVVVVLALVAHALRQRTERLPLQHCIGEPGASAVVYAYIVLVAATEMAGFWSLGMDWGVALFGLVAALTITRAVMWTKKTRRSASRRS